MPKPARLDTPVRRLIARAPRGIGPFLLVGVGGLAVHTALFTVLYHLAVGKRLSWLCALAVATTLTWTLNRRLTFAASGRTRAAEAARYLIVTAVAQGISFCTFLATGQLLPWLPASLAVVVGAGVATVFSYTGQRFFTFAAPRDAEGEVVVTDIPVA